MLTIKELEAKIEELEKKIKFLENEIASIDHAMMKHSVEFDERIGYLEDRIIDIEEWIWIWIAFSMR